MSKKQLTPFGVANAIASALIHVRRWKEYFGGWAFIGKEIHGNATRVLCIDNSGNLLSNQIFWKEGDAEYAYGKVR